MPKKHPPGKKGLDQLLSDIHRRRAQAKKGYREQALSLFPHICGHCGREFSGKRLKELTVHHKDHNHDNNPPDGSNWELLCLFCHENQHARQAVADAYDTSGNDREEIDSLTHNPFAGLDALLKKQDK